MDLKKQKLLIEYLVSSSDTYALCASIIRPDYFDPELRNTVSFLSSYYDEYNTTPSEDQIEAESGVELTHRTVTRDQIEYCSTEVESFCKQKAIQKAILSAPDLLKKNDYGKIESAIKDAITVSLNRDLGMNYFDDPLTRIKKQLQAESPTSTGWDDLDHALNGGIVRKQMLVFSANSGGGKSIAMANLGVNMMEQGFNVLYISLELSENMVSMRFDSMITGVSQAEWRQRTKEVAAKIGQAEQKMGSLTIKYMPAGTNSNAIRAYLKEYELVHGFVPDMLVVDYLDIMGTNENMSADNVFEKDKRASEQLRNIGAEYNMFIVTASQQNRGAVGATELTHAHVAGGISKVNTTDVWISIIMTDVMRAQGEIAFMMLKTRSSDGVGKSFTLKWEGATLRIRNLEEKKRPTLNLAKPNSKGLTTFDTGDGTNLIDLVSITS